MTLTLLVGSTTALLALIVNRFIYPFLLLIFPGEYIGVCPTCWWTLRIGTAVALIATVLSALSGTLSTATRTSMVIFAWSILSFWGLIVAGFII